MMPSSVEVPMIQQARSFFRESPTAVAATVGVVGGLTLHTFFATIAYGLILPIFADNVGSFDTDRPFEFTLLGVTFNYEQVLAEAFSLLLLSAVAYVLFFWRTGDVIDDGTTRDCPECKSEIWSDATRCAFCTSVVAPLVVDDGEAQ
jgi:large conductance mechanosensitive channel